MGRFVFVGGARPNFMKIAPILRALATRGRTGEDILVHTGQHYDFEMSGVFFEQLGLRPPDVELQVGSGPHGAQTGRIMGAFEDWLVAAPVPPAGVVVVGDVNSTMACALVAAKLAIPVAHVEAGLRSFDRSMPEEINRVVTDAVADLLLVSEPAGMDNLAREGAAAERIWYVGNVMIDTLIDQLPAARALDMVGRLGLASGGHALVTLHRPDNVDSRDRLTALCGLLGRLAAAVPTVFPVHPRTDKMLDQFGLRAGLQACPGLRLCPPFGYREFLGTMDRARLVVTDSGGIQEETSHLGIPCITLRSTTERPITVSRGTNTLVGADVDAAWAAIGQVLAGGYKTGAAIDGWDGHAAGRVADALLERWT